MATYLRGVTLFDGRSVRTRAGVLVSDGTIAWVGPHSRAPREARAAHEVDGTGKTLTPGPIDAHVHLCFEGGPDWEAEARGLTEARAALKAARNLARHLERGVTTVRDLGGIGAVACERSSGPSGRFGGGPGRWGCASTRPRRTGSCSG
jgi:imidazolonepropionase-like amidohydrolase